MRGPAHITCGGEERLLPYPHPVQAYTAVLLNDRPFPGEPLREGKELFLSGGSFRGFEWIDLLLFHGLGLLHMRRHGACSFLPLLCRIRKARAEPACLEFDYTRAALAAFYDSEALPAAIGAAAFLHKETLDPWFLC